MTVPVHVPPMPPLGGDTVEFTTLVRTGTPDAMGEILPTPQTVTVTGCRHRQLSASETPVEITDISTEVWQTHAPPEAAPLAADSTAVLTVNGRDYQIVGVAPFTGDDGNVLFVKIMSKRERG